MVTITVQERKAIAYLFPSNNALDIRGWLNGIPFWLLCFGVWVPFHIHLYIAHVGMLYIWGLFLFCGVFFIESHTFWWAALYIYLININTVNNNETIITCLSISWGSSTPCMNWNFTIQHNNICGCSGITLLESWLPFQMFLWNFFVLL